MFRSSSARAPRSEYSAIPDDPFSPLEAFLAPPALRLPGDEALLSGELRRKTKAFSEIVETSDMARKKGERGAGSPKNSLGKTSENGPRPTKSRRNVFIGRAGWGMTPGEKRDVSIEEIVRRISVALARHEPEYAATLTAMVQLRLGQLSGQEKLDAESRLFIPPKEYEAHEFALER